MTIGYDDARGFAAERMAFWQSQMMAKHGWFWLYMGPDDPQSPTGTNIHTHGFEATWGHPDVQIVVALHQKQAQGVLSEVAGLVKAGMKFEPGKDYDHILRDYKVRFAWTTEGDRRVLRMILPDKEGRLARGEISEPYAKQWEGTEE